MSDDGCLISVVIVIVIASCLAFMRGGWVLSENTMRQGAIQAGVAEYYLDENNNKQFRYVMPDEPKEPDHD